MTGELGPDRPTADRCPTCDTKKAHRWMRPHVGQFSGATGPCPDKWHLIGPPDRRRPLRDSPNCPTCGAPKGVRSVDDMLRPCTDIWHDHPITDDLPRCDVPCHADRPTDDDPSIVERIWSVLDAHGMGVMRKDDLDALTARIRELERMARMTDTQVVKENERLRARIRELEAAGDGSLERLTTEGTRHPFITGRAMKHYSDDVVVSRRCLQRLCDLAADKGEPR